MKHFGVKVVAVESIIVKVPVTWPDGKVTDAPREQKFARCSASGARVHMVPLMPEDEVPVVGARMKLLVPGPIDGSGARPILVERTASLI
jgi:hypothetical protein